LIDITKSKYRTNLLLAKLLGLINQNKYRLLLLCQQFWAKMATERTAWLALWTLVYPISTYFTKFTSHTPAHARKDIT